MTKITKTIIYLIFLGLVAFMVFYIATAPKIAESDIISRFGTFHEHANISIYINGKQEIIPGNIGLSGISMEGIHTHKENDQLHLEKSGLVTKDDLKVSNFFKIWGKTFNKDCILDKCNGPEGKIKFLVNGQENAEFENYVMRDKDNIEIRFE